MNTSVVALPAAVVMFGVTLWRIERLRRLLEQALCERDGSVTGHTDVTSRDFVYVRRFDDEITALATKKASDWVYDRPIIILNEDDSAEDALDTLHAQRSSCALVYDAEDALLGVLDLLDVVRHILRGKSHEAPPVRHMLRVCTVASDALTLGEVCRHLRAGSRHIAIARDDGNHQIISQRSIAQALYEIADSDEQLRAALGVKIRATRIASFDKLMCASDDSWAREAFHNMASYGITSLPVCDHSQRVRGVISATDILYARHDDALLDQPVMSYIEASRQDIGNPRPASSVVSCSVDDTLKDALRTMLEHNVHHVYALDGADIPVGVVSFVDVIRHAV